MTYQFAKFLSWVYSRFSKTGHIYLGRFLGFIVWIVASATRKHVAAENIYGTLKVSKREAGNIAKMSVTRFGRMFISILGYPLLSKDNITETLRLHGSKNLDEALSLGKGVIMASGHCGNWELLGTGLAFYGYPMVAVAKKQQQNSGFERFLSEYRIMAGGKIIYTTNVRDILRVLNENKIPLILFDHDVQENGVWVNFFGRKTSTPPGTAVIARITGSPIVPAFITEAADGTHDLYIYPPIAVDKFGDKATVVHDTMQRLSYILEEHIRKHPHEWFWLHDRWRAMKIKRPS